jgi:hypothetical protein
VTGWLLDGATVDTDEGSVSRSRLPGARRVAAAPDEPPAEGVRARTCPGPVDHTTIETHR